MHLENLTIERARVLLDSKEISVRDLTSYYVTQIKEKNDELNAFVEVFNDLIDEQVERAQAMIDKGKATILTGIPYGLKDNILYEGQIAAGASAILANHVAVYDSTVIQRMKEQGAVCLGRLNMDDGAMGTSGESSFHGPAKNPLDSTRVPGGSSSGPASAVGGDLCLFALASDTGGSIRLPATFCGAVGLYPGYGAVSRHGLISLASSMDQIGPIARSVKDAQIVHDVIKGPDPMDGTAFSHGVRAAAHRSDRTQRIGVPREFLRHDSIEPYVLENFERSLERLRTAGYEIVDIDLPHAADALAVYYIVLPAEASTNFARYDGVRYGLHERGEDLLETYFKTKSAGYGKEVKRRILLGTYVLSAGYKDAFYNKAVKVRHVIRKEYEEVLKEVDAIATPTTASIAFKLGEVTDPVQLYVADLFTVPANVAGLPAISVPSGLGAADMPLGLHLIGPRFNEDILFEIGEKFEQTPES